MVQNYYRMYDMNEDTDAANDRIKPCECRAKIRKCLWKGRGSQAHVYSCVSITVAVREEVQATVQLAVAFEGFVEEEVNMRKEGVEASRWCGLGL